ncbi:branched-chain amino acid transport system permease protein [Kribbella italica]|uniref:Branched-chain amino acid transport system permease protein n=1 Tax=Kribbella italica TaxID=1540520 RepID=A0A7W9J3N3_9ACTN|nr:branched-chain amino acid transport system permease protein [Kribbella italica]
MDQFFQQLVNGLTLGSLYALIAVGYTVVYGIVQLINFAHGEIFMIGAFGALTTYLLFFDGQTSVWILPVMIIGAIIASTATAVAMERVAYRPLRNAPRLAPLITAIGISVFLQEFIRLLYDRPQWTLVVIAPVVVWVAYVVATRGLKLNLNHPVTKWHDRTPLIAAGVVALLVWALVRRLVDPGYAFTPVVLIAGVVVGVGAAWLLARTGSGAERAKLLLTPSLQLAGGAVVLLEVLWVVYREILSSIEWPSAKQRIPFPQIDVVTGSALQLGGVTIQRSAVFTVGALIVCTAILWYFINRTRLGRGMLAVSQDPDTARLMGINVDRIIVVAFALGAVLAAVAGVSQGLQNNNIEFRMGFLAGLKAFTAAVLGGIGNIYGAVAGGLVLGVVEAMATQYIPGQFGGSTWKDVWAFVILILVLVFRPQGLLGARVVDRA